MILRKKAFLIDVAIYVPIAIMVIYFFLLYSASFGIPPDGFTKNNMRLTKEQIELFVEAHHRLPFALSELPSIPIFSRTYNQNEWGKPLVYQSYPDGRVVLVTRGGDGNPITLEFFCKLPTTGYVH